MKKLYIGIPAYDGRLHATFFISLMKFLMVGSSEIDTPPYVNILYGESHVNRVRNRLAKAFLDTDCTHLLFIDSDIIFEPGHITSLLKRDLPIVGGLYPMKELGPIKWVMNLLDEESQPDESGLVEVKYTGTGFMLIARHVFEDMIKTIPDIDYEDDSPARMGTMWDFFHAGIRLKTKRWLSEDWWFCHAWRDLDGKIFADASVQLGHSGAINFPIIQPAIQSQSYASGL